MNPKIEKLEKEIEKTKTKIAEMQAKLHKLEEQKTELENTDYYHPDRSVIQSGPVAFCGWLETKDCRPYRTEVQLYKSLLFLKRSIDRDLIVSAQREALQTLRCIISNLEYRFYKAYGMEIEDKRTVYGECTYRLVPREDEPSVCLMHDWIYLPTA